MSTEEQIQTWGSPVAHLIEDTLEQYSDSIAMEEIKIIKRAQLALEIAYQVRQRDILRAQLEVLKEYEGNEDGNT